jgi:hypothetical protein
MVENLEKTKDRNASDPIAINCFKCAEEHRQLVEWLKELKQLREPTSVVEELEAIKAEFEDKILLNQTVAIQIMNKHISELKGENNG